MLETEHRLLRLPGTPRLAVVAASGVVAFCACTGDVGPDPALGERWDSAGVEIVQHKVLEARSERTFRVHYLMEVPDTLPAGDGEFGMVVDADLLGDGSLAVLDEISADVRVFSPTGQLLHRIGRKGEGPGELSGGMTLGVLALPDGRVALPDVVHQAIVVYRRDGSHIENLPWNVMEETIPQWRTWIGDTVVVLVSGDATNAWVRRTLDGAWRDTLAVLDAPVRPLTPDGRGPLFTNRALWAATARPERFALAEMAEASISLFEGKVLRRIIRWTPNRPSLSDAQVDTLLRVVARAMGDAEGDPETALRYFNPPDRAPAVADLRLGPGIVLAQRLRPFGAMDQSILSTLRASGHGGPLWDVFSWTGEHLGILDFDGNVQVLRIRGDMVVGVREDALGVQRPFLALLPPALLPGSGSTS